MDDTQKDTTEEASVEETVTPVEETQAAESPVEAPAEETEAVASHPADTGAPAEEKAVEPEAKKASKSVSKNLTEIIEKIETLSVMELADLVHALEDKFGVTAAAPMAMAAAPAGGAGESGEAAEEKTSFDVILTAAGANKIGAIKAVRELVPTLGLKEAKDLVEAAPKPVMEGVNRATADEAKAKLTEAGATVELK